MENRMKNHAKAVIFLSTMLCIAINALAAESSEPSTTPELLSEQEFALQKEFMIKDTATKIEVLQAAHDCAKAAKTPAAFAECNKNLREAIMASKSKN